MDLIHKNTEFLCVAVPSLSVILRRSSLVYFEFKILNILKFKFIRNIGGCGQDATLPRPKQGEVLFAAKTRPRGKTSKQPPPIKKHRAEITGHSCYFFPIKFYVEIPSFFKPFIPLTLIFIVSFSIALIVSFFNHGFSFFNSS